MKSKFRIEGILRVQKRMKSKDTEIRELGAGYRKAEKT